MRRKTGRSGRKPSPERAESDSLKKSRRHSSRKHRRSSSRSSADSDDVERSNTKEEGAESNVPSDEEKSDNGSKNKSAQSPARGSKHKLIGDSKSPDRNSPKRASSLVKDDNEDSQEQEERTNEKEEKRNKGKSKGKNKSNIEQSSNIIEPETENENVQGTPQSPSNDNADNENVQNVNDSAKTNMEEQEESKNDEKGNEVTNERQENTESDINFESEYAQESTNQNIDDSDKEKNQQRDSQNNAAKHLEKKESKQKESRSSSYDKYEDSSSKRKSSSEKGERSSSRKSSRRPDKEEGYTPPEVKDNQDPSSDSHSRKSESSVREDHKSRRKSTGESGKERAEYGESSSSKKKITLRRSPPENKENERAEKSEEKTPPIERRSNEDRGKEMETQENKPSKKITLKRPTVEEKTNNGEKVDGRTEGASSRRSSTNEEFGEGKRRLSSLCEDKGQDGEEKPKKILKKIKLVRSLSRLSNDGDEERTKLSTERRQKWGRSDWLNKLRSSFSKIDVESIKIVCPSLEFLGENEVNLEATPKERRKSDSDFKRKISIDKSDDSDRPDYEKQTSEDSSGEQKIELNPNIIAMNRKISIVDDTASKLRPPPSPAKHPTSDVLFITNLVRPFTVKQLKELLERTGTIKEDGFWTDRIKSKCYVHYESVEEAEATRNALHGVHWPIGNGKKLVIDYATVEDLDKAKNPAPAPVVVPVVDKVPEKENREPERSQDKYKDRDREEKKRRDGPIREWDLGKENSRKGRSRSRSRSRERVRKHSRRSYTPDDYMHKKSRKMEESVPQKLMDDLFLKTKATPSIYWQPLSPEEVHSFAPSVPLDFQIATKQKQRLVRMEEHKRRIEETRGRLRDRRGSFRRR